MSFIAGTVVRRSTVLVL